jgi:putative NADH-flavin reductase
MRLSVFGGTRGTGLRVIEMAVAEGYQITALARRPEGLTAKFPGIRIVSGDVHSLELVKATVNHSDAVISTLGVGSERMTG